MEIRLKAHVSLRDIGRVLHRNHGVISREVVRNSGKDGVYSAVLAQEKAEDRRRRNRDRRCKIDEDPVLKSHVLKELRRGLKPHVIAGVMKYHPEMFMAGRYVCHETIFQWIYAGKGRFEDVYKYLVFQQRRRRKRRVGRRWKKVCIPERTSIHARPEGINERKEYGHWETDSMVFSRQKPRLSVQYERKAKYVMIHRLSDGTAKETEEALMKSILSFPTPLWKTITFDNGREGVNHGSLRRTFNLETYFCDPYASYQKGGVEQANGIIRRFLPRDTDMSQITDQHIYAIQETINNTPRRSLCYKTPKEVVAELCGQEVVH
ncbi:MAG: IS30 family transposase [Bacteroidota bacterium]